MLLNIKAERCWGAFKFSPFSNSFSLLGAVIVIRERCSLHVVYQYAVKSHNAGLYLEAAGCGLAVPLVVSDGMEVVAGDITNGRPLVPDAYNQCFQMKSLLERHMSKYVTEGSRRQRKHDLTSM